MRRLHDMGRTGWLMLVPTVPTVAAMFIWANRLSLGPQLDAAVPLAALVVLLASPCGAASGEAGRGQYLRSARSGLVRRFDEPT